MALTKQEFIDSIDLLLADNSDIIPTEHRQTMYETADQMYDDVLQRNAIIEAQSGATYTILEADGGKTINFTNVAGCTITLADGLSVGFQCIIANKEIGTLTLTSTNPLEAEGTLIENQYTSAVITHEGGDIWSAYGKLS